LVVKSSIITITVTQAAAPAPTVPTVSRVEIMASKTSVQTGETVEITGVVYASSAIPTGYYGMVKMYLKGMDPSGVTKDIGYASPYIYPGQTTTSYKWTISFDTAGTWKLWIEAEDTITLVRA